MNSTTMEPETIEPDPSIISELKPQEEKMRLNALHEYGILNTPSEQEFDQIAELVAKACNVPTALITFIDRDRQWVKAQVGFDQQEMEREDSFCQYCIQIGDRIMEVKDAEKNPLFNGFSVVKGEPRIRFYAGAPLLDREGNALGSLCIMDQKPRRIGRKEKFILKSLSDQIVKELEIRLAFQDLYKKHRDIHQSLNYAQKIQKAIFHPLEEASEKVPPHFVLLRPMKQVSGDFYWIKEYKEHLYLGAIDCTGHGIPGAFLSMLGVSFLNDILVDEEEPPPPGVILDRLRKRVLRELKGGDPQSGMNDGMDASLLRIPLDQEGKSKSVQFAGAHNSLYVIREGIGEEGKMELIDERDHELAKRVRAFKQSKNGIMIKGDPQPIGYFEHATESFTTIPLELQKEDALYIFSDGFPDQFGGEKGKKFRYGPFRRSLEMIHKDPMEVQKQKLELTLDEWTNGSEHHQTDDVLVIGARI